MPSALVTFIIPHWNNYLLLEKCLLSLRRQTRKDFSITVVDNGSTDGSSALLGSRFPEVRLIRLASNSGFARAANLGLYSARSPYLAFLNNDVRLDPAWLELMLQKAEAHPEAGAIASKLYRERTGEKILSSTGNRILKSGFGRDRGGGETDRGQYDRDDRVFWASGAACLIPARLFKEIGEWDEDFFAYFEDIDLGLRARLRGIECRYQPEAVGYHVGAATGGAYPELRAGLQFRNAAMIVLKDFPAPLIEANISAIISAQLRALIYLSLREHSRPVFRSWLYLLRQRKSLLKKRRLIQKNRQVSSAQIAALFEQVISRKTSPTTLNI